MAREKRLAEALQARGYRFTQQRRRLLEVMEESRQHLDAMTLYDQVKARNPNISLATVYRTLALLKEVGLVEEHRLGEEHTHFEMVQEPPHFHFTCLECGQVIEFDAPQVMEVAGQLSERERLQVTDAHLLLSGYCAQCQQEEGAGHEES